MDEAIIRVDGVAIRMDEAPIRVDGVAIPMDEAPIRVDGGTILLDEHLSIDARTPSRASGRAGERVMPRVV